MAKGAEAEKEIVRIIKEQINAPTASFFSACVNCGLCAEACLFYTETKDPRYTPINKVEPPSALNTAERVLGLRKKNPPVTVLVT